MSTVAIEAKGVSKSFHIAKEPARTLKEAAFRWLRRRHGREVFWALKNVNFTIHKGETIGLIGANGSGKSTLFKILSGIIRPTTGITEVHGLLSPMIELSAGFHPELTGIENIYLNGAIYGLNRESIEAKMPDIISFADIGEYIHSPTRTLSSGMMARLAFALAINVDAEVLLIDEVLAVGDIDFQRRCMQRIRELKKAGTTIVYVSHALKSVLDICDRVLLLHKGELVEDGRPDDVVQIYRKKHATGP